MQYCLVVWIAILSVVHVADAVTMFEHELLPTYTTGGDRFGSDIQIEAGKIAVGTECNDNHIYVYTSNEDGTYGNEIVLQPNGLSGTSNGYGNRVDISNDGSRVVTGAPYFDANTVNCGNAYVYSGADYSDEVELLPGSDLELDNAATSALFGYSTAIYGDTVVVAAPGYATNVGKVFTYYHDGVSWGSEQIFDGASWGHGANEFFGWRVDMSANYVAVSCTGGGGGAGNIYLFPYTQEAFGVDVNPVTITGSPGEGFAMSMAVSDDVLVAGAPDADGGAGTAYYYTRTDTDGWSVGTELFTGGYYAAASNYGWSVAVSHDGSLILVGAWHNDVTGSGSAAESGTGHLWTLVSPGVYAETIITENAYASPNQFGVSVALQGDGTVMGFGATYDNSFIGACHIFTAQSGSCLNGGIENLGGICDCTDTGYEGLTCADDIDDCASSPCVDGQLCIDAGANGYTCEDADDCWSSPCVNGATCTDTGLKMFTCACESGYEGDLCQTEFDECASSPCLNDGLCTDLFFDFTCSCMHGYTGSLCSEDVDECISSPCVQGACINVLDMPNVFTCDCLDGYEGDLCQSDIDDCASSPCMNDGLCTDDVASFMCNCQETGHDGAQCESDIDDCLSSPCVQGTCADDGVDAFRCICDAGYEGDLCDINIDDCASSPCVSGGTCVDGVDLFECTCLAGFTGSLCESDVDDCHSSPCFNGGICVDDGSKPHLYTCECTDEFDGDMCENELTITIVDEDDDACDSNPCVNGVCMNHVNTNTTTSFTCDCEDDWAGPLCDLVVMKDIEDTVELVLTLEEGDFGSEEEVLAEVMEYLVDTTGGDAEQFEVQILNTDGVTYVTVYIYSTEDAPAEYVSDMLLNNANPDDRVKSIVLVQEEEEDSAGTCAISWLLVTLLLMFAQVY